MMTRGYSSPSTTRMTLSRVNPKCSNKLLGWRGGTEAVHADHRAAAGDVTPPRIAHAGLDGHARHVRRQHAISVLLRLGVEQARAGHGHHAHLAALVREALGGFHGQRNLRAGGNQHAVRPPVAVGEHIAAAADVRGLCRAARHGRQGLPRQHEAGWPVRARDRARPGHRGFNRIARAPQLHIRDDAEARDVFHRLVGRAVLAEADRVVRVDEDHALLHQRGHARRVAGVIREHQEGATVRHEPAVQRDAVHDGRHAELAHAVMQVVAADFVAGDRLRPLVVRVVRTRQVGRAAEHLGNRRTQHVQHLLRRRARRDGRRLLLRRADEIVDSLAPILRQLAPHPPLELGGELGERLAIGVHAGIPGLFGGGARRSRVPTLPEVVRYDEGLVRPVDVRAGCGDLGIAERSAVGRLGALLVRRTPADDRLAADQRGPVRLGFRRPDRALDGGRIVTIHVAHDVPSIGLEATRRIVREPAVDFAVDRDAVVVVETDQLAELQGAGERAGLVRHAFHQATVAEEDPGVVVDHVVARPIEGGRQDALRQRHADCVGEALAKRAGRRLDAEVRLDFRVAGRMRAELPEFLQLLDVERVARQVQQRVQQHRAVAVRQHEAVAVGPLRVTRVVLQVVAPENLGDVGHAHRHARVPGIGFLDRIHAQRADRVGELPASRHE